MTCHDYVGCGTLDSLLVWGCLGHRFSLSCWKANKAWNKTLLQTDHLAVAKKHFFFFSAHNVNNLHTVNMRFKVIRLTELRLAVCFRRFQGEALTL